MNPVPLPQLRLLSRGAGLLDQITDDPDEEITGCSPFGCRADESALPWIDVDSLATHTEEASA